MSHIKQSVLLGPELAAIFLEGLARQVREGNINLWAESEEADGITRYSPSLRLSGDRLINDHYFIGLSETLLTEVTNKKA